METLPTTPVETSTTPSVESSELPLSTTQETPPPLSVPVPTPEAGDSLPISLTRTRTTRRSHGVAWRSHQQMPLKESLGQPRFSRRHHMLHWRLILLPLRLWSSPFRWERQATMPALESRQRY